MLPMYRKAEEGGKGFLKILLTFISLRFSIKIPVKLVEKYTTALALGSLKIGGSSETKVFSLRRIYGNKNSIYGRKRR